MEKEISNQKSRIKIEEGENFNIPNNAEVTVIDLGNKIEIKNSLKKQTNLRFYKKISENECIDTRTGEIIKYTREEFQDFKAINNKMKKLQQLIELNFFGEPNELFITLTCRNPVIELEIIKKYKNQFIKKLKYKYSEHEFSYIYKFEQEEVLGTEDIYCWHCHILLKSLNHKKLFISNEEICKIWGKGFTKTERVYNIGDKRMNKRKMNIAGYISKTSQLYRIKKKEIVFGASRNIKRPITYKTNYNSAKEKTKNNYLAEEKTYLVIDEETGKILNKHKIETYKIY